MAFCERALVTQPTYGSACRAFVAKFKTTLRCAEIYCQRVRAQWAKEAAPAKREHLLDDLDRAAKQVFVEALNAKKFAGANGALRIRMQLHGLDGPVQTDPTQHASLKSERTLTEYICEHRPKHWPIPWHLQQLVAILERAAREPTFAIVSMPPRHGKTETIIAALAWCVETWPERLNAVVTYAGDYSEQQSTKVRRLVTEHGVQLQKDLNRASNWRTLQGGGLAATGIGGQLTGKGFGGLLIVDDPIKGREMAESKRERDKAWDTFNSDVWTRREGPVASVIVVQTRWHMDDLAGRLVDENIPDGPEWEVLNLPALRDDSNEPTDDLANGRVLWPERIPLTMLRRQMALPYEWASLYQGHPVPKGGRMFRVPARYEHLTLDGARIVIGCDPAGSASARADHTAAVVLACRGYGDDATADVLEVVRVQMETDGAAQTLLDLQRKYGHAPLHIEASRDGKAIAKALRNVRADLAIVEVPIAGDKWTRAQPAAAAWNQGRIRVPLRGEWVMDFIGETELFTGISDRHDDQIDALVYAWNAYLANGAPVPVESYEGGQYE